MNQYYIQVTQVTKQLVTLAKSAEGLHIIKTMAEMIYISKGSPLFFRMVLHTNIMVVVVVVVSVLVVLSMQYIEFYLTWFLMVLYHGLVVATYSTTSALEKCNKSQCKGQVVRRPPQKCRHFQQYAFQTKKAFNLSLVIINV